MMHAGLLYHTTDEFLASALPYVREGVERGESVLAVMTQEHIANLRRALGPERASKVTFVDSIDWYDVQMQALSRLSQFLAAQPSNTRIRILGEPLINCCSRENAKRWLTMENATNAAWRNAPISMLCTHDMTETGSWERALECAHPVLLVDGKPTPNPDFVGPDEYYERQFSHPEVPKTGVHEFPFNIHTLPAVRHHLEAYAIASGMVDDAVFALVMSVTEACSNALEHGGGRGVVRMWRCNNEVVCDVVSFGEAIEQPLAQGFIAPNVVQERGRGIYLMRQLCDWVDIFTPGKGAVVRLYMSMAPPKERSLALDRAFAHVC